MREVAGGQSVGESNEKMGGLLSLVQTLIKIQIGMKLGLMASLSSQKTNE